MAVVWLLFIMAIIGVAAYLMVTYLPMPAPVKTAIVVVAVICCVLIALHAMGIRVPNPSVPQLR